MWRQLVAYHLIIIAREDMGLERTLGTIFFDQGGFESFEHYQWYSQVNIFANCDQLYLASANSQVTTCDVFGYTCCAIVCMFQAFYVGEMNIKTCRKYAPSLADLFEEELAGDYTNATNHVSTMRNLILNYGDPTMADRLENGIRINITVDFSHIDTNAWFNNMTTIINALYKVERYSNLYPVCIISFLIALC